MKTYRIVQADAPEHVFCGFAPGSRPGVPTGPVFRVRPALEDVWQTRCEDTAYGMVAAIAEQLGSWDNPPCEVVSSPPGPFYPVSALRADWLEFEVWLASILNIDHFDLLDISTDGYYVFDIGGRDTHHLLSPGVLKRCIDTLIEAKRDRCMRIDKIYDILLCLCAVGLIDRGEYQIHVFW